MELGIKYGKSNQMNITIIVIFMQLKFFGTNLNRIKDGIFYNV